MAKLTQAKSLLLAVQLAGQSDIPQLRALLSTTRLPKETVFRLLLSHLPETVDPVEYLPLIEALANSPSVASESTDTSIDSSVLDGLSEDEAKRRVRKLRLLPLKSPKSSPDIPEDALVLFLIHRSLRIDECTGLLVQIPSLVAPFIQHSEYLGTWLISCVLPLLRLNYEYYPGQANIPSIPTFDGLAPREAVALLLSNTVKRASEHPEQAAGRDIRGLIGPWMYGEVARTKTRLSSRLDSTILQNSETLDLPPKLQGWEEVFRWLIEKASSSWMTTVSVVEHWDGPGDVDLGNFRGSVDCVSEEEQQQLEILYARSVLGSIYSVYESSVEALAGVGRMLSRLAALLDHARLPTLEQAAALLQNIPDLSADLLSVETSSSLRKDPLKDSNILTSPTEQSIVFAHALATSAYIFAQANLPLCIKSVGELVLLQNQSEQSAEFSKFMSRAIEHVKQDDKYWIRKRHQILWLRDWEHVPAEVGRGPFGKLSTHYLEKKFLEALLGTSHLTLAHDLYETSVDSTLPIEDIQSAIISTALKVFENATNANKTRGGVKKSADIIAAFPRTLSNYRPAEQLKSLINVTHSIGQYKLVFKQGEPFKPVQLLVHSDPIGIIGKVLDQNPKSYARMSDFVDIGEGMVRAGLLSKSASGYSALKSLDPATVEKGVSETHKRVVSMCIDAALSEDDFETAYSYVVTRLKDSAGPAHARSPGPVSTRDGIFPDVPPKIIDDWSWRAALQAGKYRRTSNTLKPTHLGNTNANPEIRHLEQRMECLAQALRLAPKATLQEILNVYRRCEEELESLLKQEAEQEDAWDTQGDSMMPGGFENAADHKGSAMRTLPRTTEESPMSLFDLSRASVKRAQSGIASLATARNTQHQHDLQPARGSSELSRTSTPDSATAPMRKRDQLRNAAVGGLASGVGWILGAQPVRNSSDEERS